MDDAGENSGNSGVSVHTPDRRVFAAAYSWLEQRAERAGLGERRQKLLSSARGRVLEVGGGTGSNLRHYPSSVEDIVVLEPDKAMRRRLERRLAASPSPVTVRRSSLDDADLPAASFDTVVCTFVLCSVADLDVAVRRVRSLLAPGGQLLFLEHVRAPGWRHRLQRAATPAWRRLAGGCHLGRDVPGAVRAAGLVITDIDRFRLPWGGPLLASAAMARARERPAAAAPGGPSSLPKASPEAS